MYSTYEGIGFAQVDEDEEADDITKRDTKRKLKRWDFETDEEWLKYENTREATPKYVSITFYSNKMKNIFIDRSCKDFYCWIG
jgi:hypothetical protein